MSTERFDVTSLHGRRATHRWERVSIGDMLERLTWSYPDKEAIVGWHGAYSDPVYRRLTYKQADQVANQVANGLLAHGLRRSDRVLLLCENSVEAYLTKLGIAKAGLVAVPLNPSLAPDVIARLIEKTEPAFAVVDAELWSRAQRPFGETGLVPGMTIPIGGEAVPGSATFTQFVGRQRATEPEVGIHGDDIWDVSGAGSRPPG